MSKSAFRWLVIVSFVFPTLCAIGDATFFSHLIPPEIQAALDQHTEQQVSEASWGILAFSMGLITLLVAFAVNVYGLMRFKQWAPKFSIWISVACYVVLPFMGVTVMSGITYAAMSLGSALWGIVVVLPLVSPAVRQHFWPASHSLLAAGHEVANG